MKNFISDVGIGASRASLRTRSLPRVAENIGNNILSPNFGFKESACLRTSASLRASASFRANAKFRDRGKFRARDNFRVTASFRATLNPRASKNPMFIVKVSHSDLRYRGETLRAIARLRGSARACKNSWMDIVRARVILGTGALQDTGTNFFTDFGSTSIVGINNGMNTGNITS